MGLKSNFIKCEIAALDSMKQVLEALYGLKSINLTTDTIKKLGVYFSYNGTLKKQNDFLDTFKTTKHIISYIFDCYSKFIDRKSSKN